MRKIHETNSSWFLVHIKKAEGIQFHFELSLFINRERELVPRKKYNVEIEYQADNLMSLGVKLQVWVAAKATTTV